MGSAESKEEGEGGAPPAPGSPQERQRESDRDREREGAGGWSSWCNCVCCGVCSSSFPRERERERERESARERARRVLRRVWGEAGAQEDERRAESRGPAPLQRQEAPARASSRNHQARPAKGRARDPSRAQPLKSRGSGSSRVLKREAAQAEAGSYFATAHVRAHVPLLAVCLAPFGVTRRCRS
eukprot:2004124-Rhodomonas_salina.1